MWHSLAMDMATDLNRLSPEQLRVLAAALQAKVQDHETVISEQKDQLAERQQQLDRRDEAIRRYRIREEKLTHELALLRRHRFGKRSEVLNTQQLSMLDDLIEEDTAALETELDKLTSEERPRPEKQQPARQVLPPQLPRTEIRHDPASTTCSCGCALKRVGEDVSEKLDYEPGTFRVERHIRGKWVCDTCETLVQEPVAPHIIDKGIPTTNLLAQVLVGKYADHLPLYRQQQIFARADVALSRSTLADWVGRCGVELTPLVEALRQELKTHPVLQADETPVAMLSPGKKHTHRAYVWAYAATRFAPAQVP